MISKIALILVVGAIAVATTSILQPKVGSEVIQTAHCIKTIGKDLKKELITNYNSAKEFRRLKSDVNKLIIQVGHIDELANEPQADYVHIEEHVSELVKLAYHFEKNVVAVDGICPCSAKRVQAKVGKLNVAINRIERQIVVFDEPICECEVAGNPNRAKWNELTALISSLFNNRTAQAYSGH